MKQYATVFFLLFCTGFGLSQEKAKGPVIRGFGEVWDIPHPTYRTDTSGIFRAVFDVMNSPEDPNQLNPWIETAARFLNMHARAGVPVDQLQVALVVHNKASTDLLDSNHYQERFGVPNPNEGLLRELMDAGVQVLFCGQSSMARQVPIEETVDGVQLSLSAVTALIQLQESGYHLIKF
jgi:intracellular sulfur oxidation DsrE/DsrF family protein